MDLPTDDLRSTELESLEAIYPEIHRPFHDDPFTFEIELPVAPEKPVTVTFPPPSAAAATNAPAERGVAQAEPEEDSLRVSHLPSLILRIALPADYPHDSPPRVSISTEPRWLPQATLQQLENDAPRLWEEVGRDMVAYTYIDHVHHSADEVFGATTDERNLVIDAQHKLALLDYDMKAKKDAFEKDTFDCGVIILDPKKGSKCHKMIDCGHIFCLQCLQNFYNDAITEGSLSIVRCLAPNCAKDRSAAVSAARSKAKARRPKTFVNPSELLQIGLTEEMVKRYVALKYKTELETDKNTIYCPRPSCNGAARSERHRKPEGFELNDVSDAESDDNDDADQDRTEGPERQSKRNQKPYDPSDLLAICDDCDFAFCSRCYHSWHGEFTYCRPKVENGDLTAEDKASLEYLALHTSPCPTCGAPAQKTHGCNHMICSRCDSHFCYLCSAWLDPTNPYRHYNTQPNGKVTSCYMRLWELEDGDGEGELMFVGGLIQRLDQAQPDAPEPVDIIDQPPQPEQRRQERVNAEAEPPAVIAGPPPPEVAREAPLVLRIMEQRPRPAPAPPAEADRPIVGQVRGNRGRGRGGRGHANLRGAGAQRGRGGRGRARAAVLPNQDRAPQPDENAFPRFDQVNAGDDLDEAQAAWVRRFVEMALVDAEDELDGDSDDDINFLIR